jgi:hypothetical protein
MALANSILVTPLLPASLSRDVGSGQMAAEFHPVSHLDPVLRLLLGPLRKDMQPQLANRVVVGVVPLPPGVTLGEAEEAQLTAQFGEHGMHPVFVPADTWQKATTGYCNTVLWNIFHSMAYSTEYVIEAHVGGVGQREAADGTGAASGGGGVDAASGSGMLGASGPFRSGGDLCASTGAGGQQQSLEDQMYAAYACMNKAVAAAVAAVSQENEAIVIHGHQLYLLPAMLRPKVRVADDRGSHETAIRAILPA